jgi:hypothetical protein
MFASKWGYQMLASLLTGLGAAVNDVLSFVGSLAAGLL